MVLLGPPRTSKTPPRHRVGGQGRPSWASASRSPPRWTGWPASKAAYSAGRLPAGSWSSCGTHRLLVVREVGYIPFEQDAANLFFQLVSSRYEHASLILTSDPPFARWGDVFGDRSGGRGDDRPDRAPRRRLNPRKAQLPAQRTPESTLCPPPDRQHGTITTTRVACFQPSLPAWFSTVVNRRHQRENGSGSPATAELLKNGCRSQSGSDLQRRRGWDALRTAYFTSVAVWNYLATPFLFRYRASAHEIEPWRGTARPGASWPCDSRRPCPTTIPIRSSTTTTPCTNAASTISLRSRAPGSLPPTLRTTGIRRPHLVLRSRRCTCGTPWHRQQGDRRQIPSHHVRAHPGTARPPADGMTSIHVREPRTHQSARFIPPACAPGCSAAADCLSPVSARFKFTCDRENGHATVAED